MTTMDIRLLILWSIFQIVLMSPIDFDTSNPVSSDLALYDSAAPETNPPSPALSDSNPDEAFSSDSDVAPYDIASGSGIDELDTTSSNIIGNSNSPGDFNSADCSESKNVVGRLSRRQICLPRSLDEKIQSPSDKKRAWRAPADLPALSTHPYKQPKNTNPSSRCSDDPTKALFLECSGPEIVYPDTQEPHNIGYVLNCAFGYQKYLSLLFRANRLAQYCCNDYTLNGKLWAGVVCDRIGSSPPGMQRWTPQELNSWLDRGSPSFPSQK